MSPRYTRPEPVASRTCTTRPQRQRGIVASAISVVAIVLSVVVVSLPAFASGTEGTGSDPFTSGEMEVSGGSLRWGVRDQWRNYVGLGPGTPGPGATGQITVQPPAQLDGFFVTTWGDGSGTIDLSQDNSSADFGGIDYSGTMTLKGHPGDWYPNDGWGMVQTFSDPRIEFSSPTTATLSMVMTQVSVLAQWPSMPAPTRITLVDLVFDAADYEDGTATSRSAQLTAEGAALWGSYGAYIPGTQMDPVTFSMGEVVITEPRPTQVTLIGDPETGYQGEPVTLTAKATVADPSEAPRDVAGQMRIMKDGVLFREQHTVDGKVSLTTTALPIGDHSFVADFLPDDHRLARSSSNVVTISIDGRVLTSVQGSLEWGVRQSFRNYVIGPISHGRISASKGATQANDNGIFTFPQASSGTNWDGTRGYVQYAGQVRFYGHAGSLDVSLANPVVRVVDSKRAELRVPFGPKGNLITLAEIDLVSGNKQTLEDGAVRFSRSKTTLTKAGEQFFTDRTGQGSDAAFYSAGTELDRITFTIGKPSKHQVIKPPASTPKPKPKPQPEPQPRPIIKSPAAGSMQWSVSNLFAQYTTRRSGPGCPTASQHCAGGSISTIGVGPGWLFPQAPSDAWNAETQTGTVQFSGVVTFRGYGLTMFQMANPSITVTSPSSATLNTGYSGDYGPAIVSLNLAAATKTVGVGGDVTWSNVPVGGGLVGIASTQGMGFDMLTFTVGSASSASFGATEDAADDKAGYEPAPAPPSTSGLEVLTAPGRIREGGRIQIRTTGFKAVDENILVLLYAARSDGQEYGEPIVLDDRVESSELGVVEWSGMLPKNSSGPHVITIQGSSSAGAQIDILTADDPEIEPMDDADEGSPDLSTPPLAAGSLPSGPSITWQWWAGAVGLGAIAVCTTLLAVRHRKTLTR